MSLIHVSMSCKFLKVWFTNKVHIPTCIQSYSTFVYGFFKQGNSGTNLHFTLLFKIEILFTLIKYTLIFNSETFLSIQKEIHTLWSLPLLISCHGGASQRSILYAYTFTYSAYVISFKSNNFIFFST